MDDMKNGLLFQAVGINKSFGITRALADVNLELKYGQVMGLIGENGSGKSTLASIIAAIQPADSGTMLYKGKPYNPRTSVKANELGICMILQESGTLSDITVAKNIFIGKEHLFRKGMFLNLKQMENEAAEALKSIKSSYIDPKMKVGSISFENKKLVELARAMWSKPDILIVDEATTALSRTGRDVLYKIIAEMREQNKGVIFISHDIDELMEQCDALTILKDGKYIANLNKEEFDAGKIRNLMVGRALTENYYRADSESCKNEEVVIWVRNVSNSILKDINFDLHRGEILGFGGLADSGIHEIGRALYGLTELDSGTVAIESGELVSNPGTAMSYKIGYMSKNRDTESLMIASSIKDNICLPSLNKLKRLNLIFPRTEKVFVENLVDELQIKMQNINQFVIELSGGNKQKIVIAKWIGFGADILILDCPTRGIDVGVKANIYSLMTEFRKTGKSMILISEELSEVIGMSDRILIIKDGRINGEFLREEEPTESMLIKYMI
jgi:ribose transport system ATP-binding protein